MANAFRVVGLKEAKRNLAKFKEIVTKGNKGIMEIAGKEGVKIIHNRTLAGRDVNNQKFVKYSDLYAKFKGQTKVDLKLSEDMLNALSYQAFTKLLRIYIANKTHKGKLNTYNLAVVHNYGATAGRKHNAKIPQREFMGFTNTEEKKILKIIKDFYDREFKNSFR